MQGFVNFFSKYGCSQNRKFMMIQVCDLQNVVKELSQGICSYRYMYMVFVVFLLACLCIKFESIPITAHSKLIGH